VSRSQPTSKIPIAPAYGDLLIIVALVIATFAVYGQVIGHQFINLDDANYITENPMVNRGLTLAGIVQAFTSFHAANWHPLTWISHMIDCQLFGLNAGGHLFVNTLFHCANTALVFWFLRRATGGPGSPPDESVSPRRPDRIGSVWPSAIVAALFALHPLHVESVAWAAERKDTLATFFGLLSLIAYVRYVGSPSWKRYALVAVALALGLMAKPMLVTWPFVMLLLDYWPLQRFQKSEVRSQIRRRTDSPWRKSEITKLIVEKIPLFVIVALSAVVTFMAQSHYHAVITVTAAPVWLRLINALLAYAKYVWLTFWPHDLALYYPYPHVFNVWHLISAAVVLLAITLFCFSQRKGRPYLIVGWLWFLGTMVPVIGIVQVGEQAMADRYHYIPSIGLFIAIVFGLADLAADWPLLSKAAPALTGAMLLILSILTFRQVQLWHDTFTLFEHTLRIAPDRNVPIEYNLGLAFGEIGKYDEAVAHFEKALEFDPNFGLALLNMGSTRRRQGRMVEALDFDQRAVQALPKLPQAHAELGLAFAAEKKTEAAAMELDKAARLDPSDADARTNLGLVLAQMGKISEGLDTLHEALRLNPNSAEAHNNLGIILFATGKTRESIPEFEAALRLNPSLETASKNLQQAQAKLASER
jgi:protein O-mannosyl-transferase